MGVGEFQGRQERGAGKSSILLELAAADDLIGFRNAVEEESLDVDGIGLWYGRRLGLKKIGLEERTPLMVASMYGSECVVMYILEKGNVGINRACGSDAATALHCAVVGGSANVVEVVKLLLDASADANCVDVEGNRPSDLIIPFVSLYDSERKMLELMLSGCSGFDKACNLSRKISEDRSIKDSRETVVSSPHASKEGRYPVDLPLPDIKNGIYASDEFRMYTFKIKTCSRAYCHDWTECPFAHPGENARRRDPRTFHYSCVPCPEFRKGSCFQGDACEYAHGIFECWLHPAQYRTRLCKDEIRCNRKVCFFAHKHEELRPLYMSAGSGVSVGSSSGFSKLNPLTLGSPSVMIPPSSTWMTSSRQPTPMVGSMWSNQSNFAHPNLGRSRSTLSARDMDLKTELLGKESHQQQLWDEPCSRSSLTAWNNRSAAFAASQDYNNMKPNSYLGMKPTNLVDVFRSPDPSIVSDVQGQSRTTSFTGMPMHCSKNQKLCSSYPPSLSSSRAFRNDPAANSASLATARSSAFAQRSRNFIDRNSMTLDSKISSTSSANMMPADRSDWGSTNGKMERAIQKEEVEKLRISVSSGLVAEMLSQWVEQEQLVL